VVKEELAWGSTRLFFSFLQLCKPDYLHTWVQIKRVGVYITGAGVRLTLFRNI
jgi:hypothetical protein